MRDFTRSHERCQRCKRQGHQAGNLQTLVLRLDPDPETISEAIRLCGLCCSVLLQEMLNAMQTSTQQAWRDGRCDLVILPRNRERIWTDPNPLRGFRHDH